MLTSIGASDADALYEAVPSSIRLGAGKLNLPGGLSEMEAAQKMRALANRNTVYASIFRGAGAYHRYIPPIVTRVAAKEAFVTAYTPYQPEISQGVLQSIFEYQTMICELTQMDVSNASVYDGAVAAAEAAAMCREKARTVTLVSGSVRSDIVRAMQTYCFGSDTALVVLPERNGQTDLAALQAQLTDAVASVVFQYPNKNGIVEDAAAIVELAHAAGAKCVMHCEPISLSLLRTPGELSADIAVGDG